MRTKFAISMLAAALLAAPAFAQTTPPVKDPTATPGIDRRIENQERRIEQGEKSGALTKGEAARLEKREDKLRADEAKAKTDGVVTKKERAKLQREADRDSRAIYREKHDRQHDFNHDGKMDRPHRK